MGELLEVIRTDRVPPADRFAFFRRAVGVLPVPLEVVPGEPGARFADFRVAVEAARFASVTVAALASWTSAPYEARRTPATIRRADPEAYRLVVNLRGPMALTHAGNEADLGVGDMVLLDTSLPFAAGRGLTAPGALERQLTVTFPRACLPVPPDAVRPLLGRQIPGRTGVAPLARGLLVGLRRDIGRYDPAQLPGLATTVLDLVTMLVAEQLDQRAPEARRRTQLLRIQGTIVERLSDPALSPADIAAAHHLSVRSLHRLFSEHGLTVSGWIREQRLERCRRDLANPRLRTLPVYAVGQRWGFADPSGFSRTFRDAYAASPAAYRRRALVRLAQHTSFGYHHHLNGESI